MLLFLKIIFNYLFIALILKGFWGFGAEKSVEKSAATKIQNAIRNKKAIDEFSSKYVKKQVDDLKKKN